MPFTAMAIAAGVGAVVGVGKHELIDNPQADKKRELNAATQRYAPWTGLKATPFEEPNLAGTALGTAVTGASLMGSIQNATASKDLMNAQTAWLKGDAPEGATSPWGWGSQMQAAGGAAGGAPGPTSGGQSPWGGLNGIGPLDYAGKSMPYGMTSKNYRPKGWGNNYDYTGLPSLDY